MKCDLPSAVFVGRASDRHEPGNPINDDADSGSNLRMNHAEFDRYDWSNGQYALRYRVDTQPGFYARMLQWRDFSLPGPQGHALVATTTDALGRSSEFSGPDRLFADSFELP